MSCLLLSTPNTCALSTGGVQRFLITPFSSLLSLTFTDDNLNLATGIQYPGGTGAVWLPLDANRQQTRLSETYSDENGPLYDIEVVSSLVRMDEVKRGFLDDVQNNQVAAIIQDLNGRFWITGTDAPLLLTAYNAGTDTAGGANQYTFTLSGRSRFKMVELDSAAAGALFVAATDCGAYAGFQIGNIPGPVGIYYPCIVNEFF